MKKAIALILFVFSLLTCFAQGYEKDQSPNKTNANDEVPSLGIVQAELTQAEKDFQIAQKMFNPWYGGPLLTGSGNTLPKGLFNAQPYLFVLVNYAAFDGSRKSHSINNLIVVNPKFSFGVGITDRIDAGVVVDWLYLRQSGKSANHFGDTLLATSFGILKETQIIPALKIFISESFPTGKYEKLKAEKAFVDASGSGSFETTLGFTISKVLWWWLIHPMTLRFAYSYTIPTSVSVKGFNSYGGGFGADGKINPGNQFTLGLGYEFSIVQKVVFAIDASYEYANKSTFKGTYGTIEGEIAPIGGPSNDVLSFAPAIEYNFSQNLSLITGAWFSVWGRNTNNFAGGITTLTYTF